MGQCSSLGLGEWIGSSLCFAWYKRNGREILSFVWTLEKQKHRVALSILVYLIKKICGTTYECFHEHSRSLDRLWST